jgi:hypothetical protein
MENKSLVRIIKAVATHVSKDKTRSHLMCVAVTSDRRIEATDGHRAIRVDTDPPHGLPVGLYEPKKLLALLKADIIPSVADAALTYWPTLDNVIPEKATTPAVVCYANPLYIAQSAEALNDVVDGDKCTPLRIQLGADALDTIRLDVKGNQASGIALIMPMRA